MSKSQASVQAAQIAAIILGVILLDTGYRAWLGQPAMYPDLALVSVLCYLLAFVSLGVAMRYRPSLDNIVAAGLFVVFLLQIVVRVQTQQTFDQYGTDALAFNHYSAQALLHGRDPYTTSMEPSYLEFHVPATVYTATTWGGTVTAQSYPALSFLLYVPFILAHVSNMLWVDLGFGAFSMLLVLFLTRPRNRAVALLVFFGCTEYLDFVAGSVTDVVWLPFLIIAAACWDSESLVGPVMLGLACATKQEPWFIVPFAIIHWLRMKPGSQLALRNGLAAFTAFVIPNAPFIVWHPTAWVRGVLTPMLSSAIPAGSGIVQIALSGVLPYPVQVLSLVWPIVFVTGVVVYWMRHREVAWLPFVWPGIVLFFSPRSLQNYFIYWPIVLTAYLCTGIPRGGALAVRAEHGRRLSRTPMKALLALSTVLVLLVVALGRATSKPLTDMRIVGIHIDARTGLSDTIQALVAMPLSAVTKYRFAVDSPYNGAVFWHLASAWETSTPAQTAVSLTAERLSDEVPVSKAEAIQIDAYGPLGKVVAVSQGFALSALPHPTLADLRLTCARSNFVFLAEPAPLGWAISPDDFLSGNIACAPGGPTGSVLRFHVPRPRTDSWYQSLVANTAVVGEGKLAVWLRPGSDASEDVFPTHIFGVSLVDGLNHQFYVEINSKLRKPEVLIRGRFCYYLVPGEIGRWNRVTVDLRSLPFYAPPDAKVQVLVLDAVHRRNGRSSTDEFGGFASPMRP